MALRDLLSWCHAGEAEGLRSRLRSVEGRVTASKEELAGVVGEGSFFLTLTHDCLSRGFAFRRSRSLS